MPIDWGSLAQEAGTEAGKIAIKELGTRINQTGDPTRDHIPFQNQTGEKFRLTLEAYNAGTISAATAREEIARWNSAFLLLTQQIGNARALRGGAELNALAQNIIGGLGGTTGTGPVLPPTGAPAGSGSGSVSIAGMTLSPAVLAIAGAGVVYLLMGKGKR